MKYYQKRDSEIVDYQLVEVPSLPLPVRGPKFPMGKGRRTIAFVGAAQTFGTFVETPFPTLVGDELGCKWLNLGVGGAGPEAFAPGTPWHAALAEADIVVLQVMSGRSASNSRFQCRDGASTLIDKVTGKHLQADPAYQQVIETEGFDAAKNLAKESQESWVDTTIELLDSLDATTILFWFSERSEFLPPPEEETVWDLFGKYPQLVDATMIEKVESHADQYVRCVSSAGMPQQLVHRKTGLPVGPNYPEGSGPQDKTINRYYPSPEMHAEAAKVLLPVCGQALDALDDFEPEPHHYAKRDQHIADYQVCSVRGFHRQVRGPELVNGTGHQTVAFLGSAHTFGVFAERPFPAITGQSLGVQWMNLGIGGAGPSVFGPTSAYLEKANEADLLVVQAMSGRSVSNSRFESAHGFSTLRDRTTGVASDAYHQYTNLLETTRDVGLLAGLIEVCRWRWVREMMELIDAAEAPVVLLWFASRSIDEPLVIDPDESWRMMSGFPHFIDRACIRAIEPYVSQLVEVVSTDGLPQELVDAETGERTAPAYPQGTGPKDPTINSYYPSPQMHEDAAVALVPVCAELLGIDYQV